MLCAVLLSVFSVVTSDMQSGSAVFTMTFSSMETVYISLCYTEWPSPAGKFLHSSCLFHPQPYVFTIRPGFPSKIGRPLRDIQSDYIAVVINVTDSGGNHDGIRERFVVDGSLPNRSVALARELLTVDFAIVCEMDHFGPRCAQFCKPSPTNYRHIACSSTGEKICLAGWKGDNCSTVQDDGEENRVASQFTRIRERRSTLSHAGKHTLILGAVIFSIIFVGYVLCAPSTQPPGDLQTLRHPLLTQ